MSRIKGTIEVSVPMKIERDGKGFVAYSPKLKGLVTCGDTIAETKQNARNACIAYVRSLIRHRDIQLLELIVPKNAEVKNPSIYIPKKKSTEKKALKPKVTIEPELVFVRA